MTAPYATIHATTFGTLTFATQKNRLRGEVIGQSGSEYLTIFPVLWIIRRIIHLRQHTPSLTTPLSRCFHDRKTVGVSPTSITSTLRDEVIFLGTESIEFLLSNIFARFLRSVGTNALLIVNIDTAIIRMIGRWKSDVMFQYLHLQAEPSLRDYSRKILTEGNFTLPPNQFVLME